MRQQTIIWTNDGKLIDAYMRHLTSVSEIILTWYYFTSPLLGLQKE